MNGEKDNRTITVRGTARISVRPDYVNVLMKCVTCDVDYAVCMEQATKAINALKRALADVNVAENELKTTDFNVSTKYEWIKDNYGNREREVFKGYVVTHNLKVGFNFDRERLKVILAAVVKSAAAPKFTVEFTVKDPTVVKDELFAQAAANARRTAEGLCQGAGARLGEILTINYNWQELDIYKHESWLAAGCACEEKETAFRAPDIEPDDIDVSDSVTFVWKLL